MYSLQVCCVNKLLLCNNNAHKPSTKETKQSESIHRKIKNIKALDRAIFNMNMRVNGVFDKDYKILKTKYQHLDDHMDSLNRLVKLRKLKDDWEKELLHMYFKNEKNEE
jgi:hypothetical protein